MRPAADSSSRPNAPLPCGKCCVKLTCLTTVKSRMTSLLHDTLSHDQDHESVQVHMFKHCADGSTLRVLMRQAFDYWQDVWPFCGCGLTSVGCQRFLQLNSYYLPKTSIRMSECLVRQGVDRPYSFKRSSSTCRDRGEAATEATLTQSPSLQTFPL